MTSSPDLIHAAGAVVISIINEREHVLVVHRPHRSDWSLPKGKLESGEAHDVAAVREVLEETGVRCALGPFLGTREYEVEGHPKRVLYWRATVLEHDVHEADDEVDDVQWIDVDQAQDRLTYPDDRELVELALSYPETRPLIVLRHAEAVKRAVWQDSGDHRADDDSARPLNAAGDHQAAELASVLSCYGLAAIVSSDADRCKATVAPFAAVSGLSVQHQHELSEEGFRDDPDATYRCVQELLRYEGAAVWCTHRPVLPAVTRALSQELKIHKQARSVETDPRLKPSAALVLHIDQRQRLVQVDTRGPVPAAEEI